MDDMSEVLDRFHKTLVEEIRARKPEYLEGPFTVAEIYQSLVPYGSHRDRIGVDMNGDYEDALLRLLAGEGQYLMLDSEAALRQLKEEIEAPNPNTGVYREFAAVDVRLNPERVPSSEEAGSAEPTDEPDSGQRDMDATLMAMAAPAERDVAESKVGAGSASEAPEACRWCRAGLPHRDNLNYCPFCGTDVHVVPCPECGEELEPEWRFCIACGAEIQG